MCVILAGLCGARGARTDKNMLIRVRGEGRETVSMAARQEGHLHVEERGTADVSVQRHTQRQQPSAHALADNEG